jgi:transposase
MAQGSVFSYFLPDSRVPSDHPLRSIKESADSALAALSPEFDKLYSEVGRPSIAPERLLKASLLIALYSVRSDRLFCEMLDYNLLFRWFLDMNLEEKSLDQSNFSRLRARFEEEKLACQFFDQVVSQARQAGLLSDEHFTVDGTLIEAWASMKSFKPKDGPPPPTDPDGSVDFHGEKRSNKTHRSTTDPDAELMKKSQGKEAKLSFGGHALMENRNGLCLDLQVTPATQAEPKAAKALLERQAEKCIRPKTVGADRGYHTQDFVSHLCEQGIAPHIATIKNRNTAGLDEAVTGSSGYAISQRIRKRVEEIFGWMKQTGGLRKTRVRGLKRVQLHAYLVGAAYNLLRLSKLKSVTP